MLPVWLLLAPRDYLSTFVKLGTIARARASASSSCGRTIHLPAITRFVDGTGPIFAGKVFPFCFITIACGAISGFHSLISSGTTPKLLREETDAPMIGYGCMLLESFVAIMAMIAAAALAARRLLRDQQPGRRRRRRSRRRRRRRSSAGASR